MCEDKLQQAGLKKMNCTCAVGGGDKKRQTIARSDLTMAGLDGPVWY